MSNATPQRSNSENQTEVLVGRRIVLEALERNVQIARIYIQQKVNAPVLRQLRHEAGLREIPVQYIPKSLLDKKAAGALHQGVAAELATVPYHVLEEMLNAVAADTDAVRDQKPIILMLDGIEDPHNYGALLRTALGAGIAGVIVGSTRQAPLSSVAVKASAGAAFRIPIARTDSLPSAIEQLKERGYWIVGSESSSGDSFWECDWARPLVLVVGSEGRGLQPSIRDLCDFLLAIPMIGDIESLNVSVAGGIMMFEALRARR